LSDEDELLEQLRLLAEAKARDSYYAYMQYAAPWILPEGFVDGNHIREIAELLQWVEETPRARAMIFMPPRSMKSVNGSVLFPTWILGRHPTWQVMGVSYGQELANAFGRDTRNLIMSEDYQRVFDTRIKADSRATNRWDTEQGGRYVAAGITAGIAGRGANIAIIDDPLSEQDAMSKASREFVKNWWPGGLRSRLQPDGRIVIITTRWHEDDLAGWLLTMAENDPKAEQWRVLSIPALSEEDESYWPERWPAEYLRGLREDPTMPRSQWNALYMQEPTGEEGNLIKAENLKWWKQGETLPQCDAILMSADTAFGQKETSDYSVLQIWGIFNTQYQDSRGKEFTVPNALLLANRRGRWEYPELLNQARQLVKKYNPDRIIVEKKASGEVLYPDLMRAGLPVVPYIPGKGQDKVARVHACLRFFVSGRVWLPEGEEWSYNLAEEALAFPKGKNDDQVDAMTMALLYLRDSYALYNQDDSGVDGEEDRPHKRKTYWT
jgi:predicted phage terminase large subunit-like protein